MKRTYKLLILSIFALILSAFTVTSASASEAPEIAIKGAAFDNGEITLTYAVSRGDDTALKLIVWDSYPIAGSVAIHETTEFADMTIGDASYKVFSSSNIALHDLRKPYYAAIVTLNEDGEEQTRGDIVKFSVFEHLLTLLSTGIEDQIALFTKLLNIGAAMQKQLLGTALYSNTQLTAAGGYANEYYALTTHIYVDGELTDSTTEYYSKPTASRLVASKVIGDAAFAGFYDAEGTPLKEYGELTSSSWNEYLYSISNPGIAEIFVKYETGNALPVGYDKSTLISNYGVAIDSGTKYLEPSRRAVTVDKKGVASSTTVAGSAYAALSSKAEEKFLGFYKIISALKETTYSDEAADKSGAYKIGDIVDSVKVTNCGMSLPAASAKNGADIHVFETDLYVYCPKNTTPTYVNLLNADGEAFWGFNIKTEGSGSTFSLTVKGGADDGKCFTEGLTLMQRDWYNLRIEYSFNESDEVEIKIFIDGKYTATYTSPASTAATEGTNDEVFDKVYFYHSDSVNNATLKLDNTIITSGISN